jgi:hypothetical protein
VYLTGIIVASNSGNCAPSTPATKGELALQRPANPIDEDAYGHVQVSKKGKEQEFKVDAKNLSSEGTYNVFLETALGSGVLNPLAGMSQKGSSGRFELKLEADCAAPAILGVADLAALEGFAVEIRNGNDEVILRGTVPSLTTGTGQGNFNKKGNLSVPDTNPPSPNAKGRVSVKFNAPKGESEIEVEVESLANGNNYSVWIENGNGSNVLEKVGNISFKGKGKKSKGKFEAETKKGGGLPFGVATVGSLSGRKIEVRDGGDAVHLLGLIP